MSSSAGCSSLALHTDDQKESSDDSPACLENPRPAGAESTLTENVASPFQAEPRHSDLLPYIRGNLFYVVQRYGTIATSDGVMHNDLHRSVQSLFPFKKKTTNRLAFCPDA
jgi:hypothetical protein